MLPSGLRIIEQATDLYTKNFKAFREPLTWIMVPMILITLLPIIPGATSGTELLLKLIYLVILLCTSVVITDISWALHEGRVPPASLTSSLSWGSLGRIVDFSLMSLLYGLIIVGGTILVIVPGILFGVWFYFSPLATLLDGSHGTGALKRSKELVSGRFWAIAWRMLVINFIPWMVISLISGVIVVLIALAAGAFDSLTTNTLIPWWLSLPGVIISTLAIPFFFIAKTIFFAEARKPR
ncbi:MAG: hypothetical protein WCJ29_02335 [bacterium]